jgi:hypothetical protein
MAVKTALGYVQAADVFDDVSARAENVAIAHQRHAQLLYRFDSETRAASRSRSSASPTAMP